jgi:hypothetical protein
VEGRPGAAERPGDPESIAGLGAAASDRLPSTSDDGDGDTPNRSRAEISSQDLCPDRCGSVAHPGHDLEKL